MRSLGYIIVKAEKEYNNQTSLGNSGIDILTNSTVESVSHINREVEVVCAPTSTVLNSGDRIIIHHNILRKKNNTSGEEVKSDYFIEDDLYYVPPTEIFAVRVKDSWEAIDPYCFIKPIDVEREELGAGLVKADFVVEGHKGKQKNVGLVKYPNRYMKKELGLKEGDKIAFSDDSEYEFEIEGELLYRMKSSDILGKYN